ncbi:MAG: bifunctional phosphopantothenoylcysteine decarboxylase/phosphopantothenate--cysteine ligase CoaBC [Gammaproteobacteria bacterium]|nr:bifunctional phosphopantothenoylcysteine decarboxylase/phosphopantothenate--cysteine ligase CoaBC [Gammaproteobacteria bacterium]
MKILLGVTGSIAAYKALDLVSQLVQCGAEVKVVMSQHAKQFVAPLSFATLSHHTVYDDLFEDPLAHIELAKWPDLIVIAPATAQSIAKYRGGFAEDLLGSILLATSKKVVMVAAMNQAMWAHPAVVENVHILTQRGVDFLGPMSGLQACGDMGVGRMMEVADILCFLPRYEQVQSLKDKTVLITAGPTQEALDPVRYLSNHSSGKMGYALAHSCYNHGAKVILIAGPNAQPILPFCETIPVVTAAEMRDAVISKIDEADIFIACAAVCDFKPNSVHAHKIKKQCDQNPMLSLQANPDILAEVAARPNRPFLVGFSAETESVLENAQQKFHHKQVDLMIANQVGPGLGFSQDEHELTLIHAAGIQVLPKMMKSQLADQIVSVLSSL